MEDCPIKVFLDISADDKPIGRLIFEVKDFKTILKFPILLHPIFKKNLISYFKIYFMAFLI